MNTSHPAAKLWYDSNAALYQEFGIDFIKGDCFYGKRDETASGKPAFSGVDDAELLLFANSIASVSAGTVAATGQPHRANGKPIIISLSPGVDADVAEARPIHSAVNMYRISDDLHDCWNNASSCDCSDGIRVTQQFERLRAHQVAGLIGAAGFRGKSWPDPGDMTWPYIIPQFSASRSPVHLRHADMLPVGPLARSNALTWEEQRVTITLWAVARAPMIVGADLNRLDSNSTALIANPEVLNVNQQATESFQLKRSGMSGPWGEEGSEVVWAALLPHRGWALALFNLGDTAVNVGTTLGVNSTCSVRDLWMRTDIGTVSGMFSRHLDPHSAAFVVLSGDRCPAPTAPKS